MSGYFRYGAIESGGFPIPGAERRPYVTWMLLAVNFIMWVIVENAGGSEDPQTLLAFGAMFGPLIASGEYWRLFTAMFLHVGIMHLFFNSFGLFIFGRTVERIYGHTQFTIIYMLAGLCGSVASFTFNKTAIGAGASGAIFGVLAALAAFLIARRSTLGDMGRQSLTGILVLAAINLLFGFIQPGIDNWAHMGGFAGGFAVGYIMAPRYRYREVADRFGIAYRMVNVNSLAKSAWIVPVVAGVIFAGVWLGIQRSPDSAFTHLTRAERLFQQEDYEGALAEIRQAIELDPTEGRAFYLRGRIRAEFGDRAGARSDLSAALRMGLDDETRQDAIARLVALRASGR